MSRSGAKRDMTPRSTDAPRDSADVVDNPAAQRFELALDGETAFLQYERSPGALVLVHTEVPEAFRGRHLGDVLVKAALDAADQQGLRIIAVCPFVRAYLRKHAG